MKTLPWILLFLISLSFLGYREYTRPMPCKDSVQIIRLPGDSIPGETIIQSPRIIYRDTGQARWMSVDTSRLFEKYMALLRDFNAVTYYGDTLKNDSSAFAYVESSVNWNQLKRIRFEFQNRRPTTVVMPTIETPVYWNIYGTAGFGNAIRTNLSLEKGYESELGCLVGFTATKERYGVGLSYNFVDKMKWVTGHYRLFRIKSK